MLNLEGTHGTSQSRANKIEKNGFQKSPGRIGVGIYFWCAGAYAEDLAIAWYDYCFSEDRYSTDKENGCVVIYASFRIKKEEFLDLEKKDIKDQLAGMAKKRGLKISDRKNIHSVRARFIDKLEHKMEVRFKVIEASVPLPDKQFCYFYPISLLGSPHNYIVRDENCIIIDKLVMVAD